MSQSIGAVCIKVCITLSENKKMREKLRARFEAREKTYSWKTAILPTHNQKTCRRNDIRNQKSFHSFEYCLLSFIKVLKL